MMQDELNGLQVKKKTLPGPIDVHPTEQALVIHYTVQASIYDVLKTKVAEEQKEMSKTVRFKTLTTATNLSQMAQDIVDKCSLIAPSRLQEVEQCLYYLLQRNLDERRDATTPSPAKRGSAKKDIESDFLSSPGDMDGDDDEASMALIETYIEGLYEEMKDKITATRKILALARVPENQEPLISNESLISALCRVLREDGKRSMELVTNIIYVFFCFSNFSEFHEFLTTNKLGDMCFKIIDHEKARYQILVSDMKQLEGKSSNSAETEQKRRRLEALLKRQDQLFFLTLHLLLNISENLTIEVKVMKRGIIGTLIMMLDRPTLDLAVLSVTFLKKLSIFEENIEDMIKFGDELVTKLVRLIPNDELALQDLVFRLLANMSHNAQLRSIMVKSGILTKLVILYENGTLTERIVPLLYQLSIDEKNRALPAFTDAIPATMRTILEHQEERVPVEVMALAINLSTQSRNAQLIVGDSGLKFLTKRALKTRDPLLFRMMRILAQHDESIKMQFLDFIDPLMILILKPDIPSEILVEAVGIVANLTIDKFDFAKLVGTYPILPFIYKTLSKLMSQSSKETSGLSENDDVALELVRLVGTLSMDDAVIPMIAREHIPQLMTEFMVAKEEEDEIVLQALYCINRFMYVEVVRTVLMQDTDVVSYLVDLLYDSNVDIRRLCDASLDIIAEVDDSWVAKIRQQKFQWHNAEWLQLISREADERSASSPSPRGGGKRPVQGRQGKMDMYEYDMDSDDDGFQSGRPYQRALLDGP